MWLGAFDVGVLDLYFRLIRILKSAPPIFCLRLQAQLCAVWKQGGLEASPCSSFLSISFSIHATAVSNWTFFFPSPKSLKFIFYFFF